MNTLSKSTAYSKNGFAFSDMTPLKFVYNDGGRAAAGFKGQTEDCVTRAIAIATGRPYREVYHTVNDVIRLKKKNLRKPCTSSARTGVIPLLLTHIMKHFGFEHTNVTKITGTDIKHISRENYKAGVFPEGVIIARLKRHVCVIKDGVVHDTFNPAEHGKTVLYGYWVMKK